MMLDILFWPFRLLLGAIGLAFDLVGAAFGLVFGLVGGILGLLFGGSAFVLLVLGILWFARAAVRRRGE